MCITSFPKKGKDFFYKKKMFGRYRVCGHSKSLASNPFAAPVVEQDMLTNGELLKAHL